jgi:hypothetical protein
MSLHEIYLTPRLITSHSDPDNRPTPNEAKEGMRLGYDEKSFRLALDSLSRHSFFPRRQKKREEKELSDGLSVCRGRIDTKMCFLAKPKSD